MPHEVVAGAIIVAPAVLAAGSREPSAPRYIVVNGRNITQPKVNNEMVTFERHISQYDFLDHFARYTHRPRFRAFLSKEHSSVASSRRSRQECRAPMLGIALKMAYRRPSLSSTITFEVAADGSGLHPSYPCRAMTCIVRPRWASIPGVRRVSSGAAAPHTC